MRIYILYNNVQWPPWGPPGWKDFVQFCISIFVKCSLEPCCPWVLLSWNLGARGQKWRQAASQQPPGPSRSSIYDDYFSFYFLSICSRFGDDLFLKMVGSLPWSMWATDYTEQRRHGGGARPQGSWIIQPNVQSERARGPLLRRRGPTSEKARAHF